MVAGKSLKGANREESKVRIPPPEERNVLRRPFKGQASDRKEGRYFQNPSERARKVLLSEATRATRRESNLGVRRSEPNNFIKDHADGKN